MDIIEVFGLAMSATIAISLTQKSLLRLRIINLAGSLGFAVYGMLISSYSVIALNIFTALANLWYLRLMLRPQDEAFEILSPPPGERTFINHFIKIHYGDIRKFNPSFSMKDLDKSRQTRFFPILSRENMVSLVICRKENRDRWEIVLDYAVPSHRDLKSGLYFYQHAHELLNKGTDDPIRALVARSTNGEHIRYLEQIGFIQEDKNRYVLFLDRE